MIEKTINVVIQTEREVKPVAMLVQLASQFDSSIHLKSGNKHVNAKSIMGMITLGLVSGEELTITTEGKDEEAAMECLVSYLTSGKA